MDKRSKKKSVSIQGKEIKQPDSKVALLIPKRYSFIIPLLLITIMAILIYSNTFSSTFHFDDRINITENYQIRDLSNLWPPSGMRYIGDLSFAINYYFGGLDVFGYHLVNLIIHIINGILVWWLVILIFKTPRLSPPPPLRGEGWGGGEFSRLNGFIAITSALIFVSHPIQTQAVTYIVQRYASLATMFYLMSLVMYIKGRLSHQARNLSPLGIFYIALSLLSAILAMKTKEISFTLPFVILLFEILFFRFKIAFLIPFIVPFLIIPLGFVGVGKPLGDIIEGLGEAAQETEMIPRGVYLLTQFRVIVTYIRLLFLPVNQNLDYDYPLYTSFFTPGVFLSFIFLLSIFGLAIYIFIRSRRRDRGDTLLLSFGILWFFITLSVESSIIPIRDVIFEHRLYLPSVGVVIAFSATVFYCIDYVRSRVSPLVVTSILLLVTAVPLGIAAYNRNWVWKDGITLWKDVVRKSPAKARGYNNLGTVYRVKGLTDDAIEHLRTAIRLRPDYSQAHNNLGNAYSDKGLTDKAIEHLRTAIRLRPDFAAAHSNLGTIYSGKGLTDDAIEHLQAAIRLRPDFIAAHYNLGTIYSGKGLTDDAIEHLQAAIRLRPDYPAAHYNLGTIYSGKGLTDDAIEHLQAAIRLRPDYPAAHYNLGTIYFARGLYDEAIRHYQVAIRLKPDYAEAHFNLGKAYMAIRLVNKAREHLRIAEGLNPSLKRTHQ